MGSAASSSLPPVRFLHVIHGKKEAKVRIEALCCRKEIQEAIALSLGIDRRAEFVLRDSFGNLNFCSALMETNTSKNPYEVIDVNVPASEYEVVAKATHLLAEQMDKILHFESVKSELMEKLTYLERRLDRETLKLTEISKLRNGFRQLQENISSLKGKMIDFNRFRPAANSNVKDTFYVPVVEAAALPVKGKQNTWWQFTKYQLSDETITYLKTPTFNIWQWDHNEMVVLLEYMFQDLGIIQKFNINNSIFRRWLLAVQENYRNNPFHNFRHSFCVSQMMYGLIHACHLNDIFSVTDLTVLMTAAVCHDVDHPGFNNTYQINARTDLAIRYNDVSPLEQHHCAVTFQILANPDLNIFANVDEDQMRQIRSGIIELILATDMARHGEILDGFRKVADNFDTKNPEHLVRLKMILIKACDISNEVRPMDVSGPWVECLLEEYFRQAERERSEGLPVAPFMDKEKVTKASAQIGFIQFVLSPLFESLTIIYPQLQGLMVAPLKEAQEYYVQLEREDNSVQQ